MCNKFNIELASGLFVNEAAIKAARKAGFKESDDEKIPRDRLSIKCSQMKMN